VTLRVVTRPCRAFIVDDDEDLRFLIASTIEFANDGLEVAGVAASGDEALAALPQLRPDVIVLDFRMPDRDGLDIAAAILADDPKQNVVIFSAYIDADTEERAERIGVRECVSKDRLKALPEIIRHYCAA
jgi:two-component system response regulator YesN